MANNHDIFLRAYVVPVNPKHKPKRKRSVALAVESKWPIHALIFDTETRITADQSLTFGVYRCCELQGSEYRLIEEGIFYADDLPTKERKVLERYEQTAIQDVPCFPPVFPIYSRSEFMRRVFWPAIKRDGALICGLNLPFDLSRLALDWDRGLHDEWSLIMSRYKSGDENRNRPRILITPIDSKKAFIRLARPWNKKEWKNQGRTQFVDLRTLGWGLFNKSFSLKSLCEQFKTKNQKFDHEPTGKVTPEEINYARQDGRCTVDALNSLKREFDQHPIDLKPSHVYSPASIAKAYLRAMGIIVPAEKFKFTPKKLGIAMQSYYGGRSETRVRSTEVPVVPLDFTSEYPTCCALLGLFDVLTAASLTYEDCTEAVRQLLKTITLETCFTPAIWQQFKFFALVQPNKDLLPVRTNYDDGVTQNIGNNYLTSDTPLWFAGCDLIASVVRTGKVPNVIRAARLVPHGKQPGMRSINLRGSMVKINPYRDDLFRKVIEQRKLHKTDEALYYWLKILANSIYGFFVELVPEDRKRRMPVIVFSGERKFLDASEVIEKTGEWFFPPLASLITAAGRLLLAMTEACVEEKKGTYLFCDTDSLAIVSSKSGGSLKIPGSEGKRILSWDETTAIADRFAVLNPYNRDAVKGSILNLVDANYIDPDHKESQRDLYGYSIAAKRYALYERPSATQITVIDPKAHGIGFLYPPKDSPKKWKDEIPKWIYEMWDYILRGSLGLKRRVPSWLQIPQMMRLTITTHNVLTMLGEWEVARPYNFLLLPMVDPIVGFVINKRPGEKVLPVCPYSSKQREWFDLKCVDVRTGESYKMVDYTKNVRPRDNMVFPKQFSRLVIEYQTHPEAKSLAPDGGPCRKDTKGLLGRAHIVAGELRYVGKETERKWEEADDITVLEFETSEFGRAKMVSASEEVKSAIREIGIKRCAREGKLTRFFIRKLLRGGQVRRRSYERFVRWLENQTTSSPG